MLFYYFQEKILNLISDNKINYKKYLTYQKDYLIEPISKNSYDTYRELRD